jgi:lipopolysaccharide export system permease protein
VNPRIGRSANLLSAAFLYLLYSNCLNIVQSLILQGRMNFWVGLALPHVVALLLVFVLFRNRLSVSGWLDRLRNRARRG